MHLCGQVSVGNLGLKLKKKNGANISLDFERKVVQLTGVRADGEGEDPEEEGECQSGTKHDHISHHLQVFLHQHVTLRAHDDRRTVLQDRRHVRQTHQCTCVLFSYLIKCYLFSWVKIVQLLKFTPWPQVKTQSAADCVAASRLIVHISLGNLQRKEGKVDYTQNYVWTKRSTRLYDRNFIRSNCLTSRTLRQTAPWIVQTAQSRKTSKTSTNNFIIYRGTNPRATTGTQKAHSINLNIHFNHW